jgi:2-methylcitrate dehydratase PrpD
MINLTDTFTNYILDKSNAIPEEKLIHQSKRCLLDYLSVVYAGKGVMGNQAIKLISRFPDVNNGSSVIGFGSRKSTSDAAFLNGYISHVAELDDGVNSGIVHPGTPAISALLALAQERRVNGLDLLKGIVAAYETTIRLANAVQPSHKKKGYHATGTIGAVGAAAGLAVMCNSSKSTFKNAVSAALISAGGSLKALEDASQLKPFNVGNAARSGLTAFLVAEAGIEGPNDSLGGEMGFLNMMSGFCNTEKLHSVNPGYAINDIYIKPYAACRYCHPAIEASIKISISHSIKIDEINGISVVTYDLAVKNHDHTSIPNISSAKMSIPFSVATAILNNKAGINEFSEIQIQNEVLKSLTQKVSVRSSPEFSNVFPEKSIAEVNLKMNNGDTYSKVVEYPKGEPENPLSDEELMEKFIALCKFGGSKDKHIREIIDNVWAVDTKLDRLYTLISN